MSNCRKHSILFLSAFEAPFIQDDYELLEEHYDVLRQTGHGVAAAIKIFLRTLTADLLYCYFASVYAAIGVFAARRVGIKSIIVVAGVDAAKDEELGYGIWLSSWRAPLVRYALRRADRVLVVAPILKDELIRLAGYDGKNISFLATGYDTAFWKPAGVKEPFVMTVAVARDERTWRRKGLDLLLLAAEQMPEVQFIVVGVEKKLAQYFEPPANMMFYPRRQREELLPLYQRAKVYCQPSRREGLPNALCEAMACGCIPVVTEVSGNPTAVGDSGVLVPSEDAGALGEGLKRALAMGEREGVRARSRIVALFQREQRERELTRIVEELFA